MPPVPEGAAAPAMVAEAAIPIVEEPAISCAGIDEDDAMSVIILLLMPDPPPEPYCAKAPPARSTEDARGSIEYIAGLRRVVLEL